MDAQTLVNSELLGNDARFARDSLRLRRAHLVGVAGSGMRALADVLAGWGWRVSGSDCCVDGIQAMAAERLSNVGGVAYCSKPSPPTPLPLAGEGRLDGGVRLFQGHAAENLPADTELVIYSDAVPADNPELCRAAELGIPTLSYFEMLGRLSGDRHTVAVAGTHGKSTTTAMARPYSSGSRMRSHGLLRGHGLGRNLGRTGRRQPTACVFQNRLPSPFGRGTGGEGCGSEDGCDCRNTTGPHPSPLAKGEGTACATGPHPLPKGEGTADAGRGVRVSGQLSAPAAAIMPPSWASSPTTSIATIRWSRSNEPSDGSPPRVPADGLLLVRHDCASTRRATAGLACRIGVVRTVSRGRLVGRRTNRRPRRRVPVRDSAIVANRYATVRLRMPGRHNRAERPGRRRLGLGQRRHGRSNRRRAQQFCRAAPAAGSAGHVAGRHLRRRLRPSPHRSGGRAGNDPRHVPPPTGVVRLPAAPGVSNGPTAGPIGRKSAKCRQGIGGRDFRAREGNPRPGEVTAADLARADRRAWASRCCRAIRPKKSSARWKPILPPATYWLR